MKEQMWYEKEVQKSKRRKINREKDDELRKRERKRKRNF